MQDMLSEKTNVVWRWDIVLHRKRSVQRQRRWIEDVTEWIGL